VAEMLEVKARKAGKAMGEVCVTAGDQSEGTAATG